MTARAEVWTGIHGADHTLLQDVGREFATWVRSLPARTTGRTGRLYPSAQTPGWLPPSWVEHGRLAEYAPQRDMYLLRPKAGGWALITHDTDDHPRTQLFDSAATLRALHADYRDTATDISSREPIAQWLGRVLAGLYDPSIEAEAAARVIVALGGVAPFEPSAALPPG